MIVANGLTVTMDSANRVMQPGWIRIDGAAIVEISDRSLEPRPGEEVLDATNMVVLPGLINTHTHLFQTLLRAVYDNELLETYLKYIYRCGLVLSREDSYTSAMIGSVEAISSGVTTVTDHHFINRGNELVSGTIDGILATGARAVVARTVMDIGEGLPEEIKERPESAMARVDELIDAYQEQELSKRLTIMTGPNTPGINASEKACRVSSEFARDRGRRQSSHVAEYRGVRSAVLRDHGVDGVVRWLGQLGVLDDSLLAVHSVQVDRDEVAMLADRSCTVSHNPFSNLFCGDVSAPVAAMLGDGISVGLGTDGAANNNGQDVLDAMRITRSLQRREEDPFAISDRQGLEMATIGGARSLGLDHLIGSIEVGKRADIILLDRRRPHLVPFQQTLPHLARFAKGSDVDTVIVDGVVILKERQMLHLDVDGLYAETNERGRSLVERLER